MKIQHIFILTSAIFTLSASAFAAPMRDIITPENKTSTTSERTSQLESQATQSTAPDPNQVVTDGWYFDKKTHSWKQQVK